MRAFGLLALVVLAAAQTAVWESGLNTVSDVPFSKSLSELPEVKAPSATAAPGRSGHCSVFYGGSLYIFGGQRANAVSNDLWRYEAATGKWEFLLGAKEANHPGTSALPAARSGHSCVLEGTRFLIFGGHKGNGENLADVWAYSFAHNDWQSLSSGQRVPSYTNGLLSHPGARTNHEAIFLADSKTMVIFGGRNSQGLLNDVWQYQVDKGLWHFLGGSQKANAQGVYPATGKIAKVPVASINAGLAEPAPLPQPGAREFSQCALGLSKTLVCYGGKGYAVDNTVGLLADVWSFDVEAKKWSFVHGHQIHKVDVRPLYPKLNPKFASGTKKLRFRASESVATAHELMHEAGSSCPGGRVGAVFGIDLGENVAYVFGGKDADGYELNDLWSFDLVKQKWNFLRGSTVSSSYGVKGKLTPGAFPPARVFSAGSITPSNVNAGGKRFLIFSGQTEKGVFGDLWSIELSKKAGKPKPKSGKSKSVKPNKASKADAPNKAAAPKKAQKPAPAAKPATPEEPPIVTGEVPRAGCCDAKTPVTVGPYNIPNTKTREVQVIGDRENRIPVRLDIPKPTSWYKGDLKTAEKHLKTVGAQINAVKKTHKKLRNRPLVDE